MDSHRFQVFFFFFFFFSFFLKKNKKKRRKGLLTRFEFLQEKLLFCSNFKKIQIFLVKKYESKTGLKLYSKGMTLK